MSLLPHMSHLPYAMATCSLRDCNHQAVMIAANGFKLCSMHSRMFHVGQIVAERLQSEQRKPFDLDALGELTDDGDVKSNPSGEKQR